MRQARPAAVLACAVALAAAGTARAAGRLLVDEVVAEVATRSITLSEVRAEARIKLLQDAGPAAALLEPDRALLAATLQGMVNQRLVLTEVESLHAAEIDKQELETALLRLRMKFGGLDRYEAFTRAIEMTDEEIGDVLARQLRYVRYIDSGLKLKPPLRDAEVDDACVKQLGRKPDAAERESCKRALLVQRYQAFTEEMLDKLRKRTEVRILDPLLPAKPKAPEAAPAPRAVGRAG